jgi:hypothetical protein
MCVFAGWHRFPHRSSAAPIYLIPELSTGLAVITANGESQAMNKKNLILALTILVISLFAYYAASRVNAASVGQKTADDPVQDLRARVSKLERQVAMLQEQIKNLSAKASSRVLTIPETRGFSRDKMPPGATEHEFNGMKYWSIPLKDDQ